MSGNTTNLAVSITHHQWPKVAATACLIGLFVGGVAVGDVIEPWGGRRGHSLVLAVETLFLGLGVVLHWPGLGLPISPLTALYPLVFAMGLQNATMHRAGGIGIGLTYVTGTLVQIGRGIGALTRRSGDGQKISKYVALWLSLAVGGGLGALALSISMLVALSIATAAAAGLAVVALVTRTYSAPQSS